MKKISGIIILVALCYVTISTLQYSVKNTAVSQNELNIHNIKVCIEGIPGSLEDERNFINALDVCAKGSRSMGITGDVFVIRHFDKMLIWDSSTDCKLNNIDALFMTSESVCKLFKKPETCINAVNEFLSAQTDKTGNTEWLFDESVEYVSFKQFKIKDNIYTLGQGAQHDESMTYFNSAIFAIVGSFIVAALYSVIFY